MKYDISILKKEETVLSKFPELKDFKTIGQPKYDILLKVALYAADKTSPFARIREFDQRYIKIFTELKINNQGLLDSIIDGSNKEFHSVIFEVFQVIHNVRFTAYLTNLNLFYNMSSEIANPLDPEQTASQLKNRLQISDMLDSLITKIEKAEGDLFNDEAMKDMVLKQAVKISSFPERYANSDPLV